MFIINHSNSYIWSLPSDHFSKQDAQRGCCCCIPFHTPQMENQREVDKRGNRSPCGVESQTILDLNICSGRHRDYITCRHIEYIIHRRHSVFFDMTFLGYFFFFHQVCGEWSAELPVCADRPCLCGGTSLTTVQSDQWHSNRRTKHWSWKSLSWLTQPELPASTCKSERGAINTTTPWILNVALWVDISKVQITKCIWSGIIIHFWMLVYEILSFIIYSYNAIGVHHCIIMREVPHVSYQWVWIY